MQMVQSYFPKETRTPEILKKWHDFATKYEKMRKIGENKIATVSCGKNKKRNGSKILKKLRHTTVQNFIPFL